ncbi:MAG: riboflavin synthase [Micromonosporaceae bacterium]|nr:riboflavin synthase [Micromonosporaceae bacterium]
MFTGIVEELGEVVGRDMSPTGAILAVRGPRVVSDARDGDSIAVNGVCLTVRAARATADWAPLADPPPVPDLPPGSFVADVMRETLDRTALGELAVGDPVNLERAATLGTRLGGHLVQGHVDGVGVVIERASGERDDLTVSMPRPLLRYLVAKGSITVDGVSLTVVEVGEPAADDAPDAAGWFSVSLIPTTLAATTLGTRVAGDRVNLEVDVIAKYVERLVGHSEREVRA